MKSKELIEEILKADPSGELEVCIGGNDPIDFVSMQEAYYDGNLEILIKDSNGKLKGYKVTGNGYKIIIHTKDLYSCFSTNINLELDMNELSEYNKKRWESKAYFIRQEILQIKAEIEDEHCLLKYGKL